MTEGVVKFAVDKLEEMAVQELKLQTEVGKKVLELRHELEWLRTFLRDADRKRRQPLAAAGGDDLIEVWVRQTRELAHDAEDLLEEFVHKGELHCHGCFDLPSFLRWLRHSAAGVFARHAIFDEIEDIKERIEGMKKQRKECNLEKLSCASKPHRKQYTDWSTLTELEIEDNLHVETEDYNKIKSWLLDKTPQTTVIALTGKSGIGKTTLASYLYRKSEIRKHFTCAVWVHVPQKFRFIDLLNDIVCQATATASSGDEAVGQNLRRTTTIAAAATVTAEHRHEGERLLKRSLEAAIQGERYLIVLDDVRSWEEWAFFLAVLPTGLPGSSVLVTTHLKFPEVPSSSASPIEQTVGEDGDVDGRGSCSSLHVWELKKLDSDQATKLFCQRMYGKVTPDKQKQLWDFVDSMTKGATLPLNVVMLAGLLRSKRADEWNGVLESLDGTMTTIGEPTREQKPEEAEEKKKRQARPQRPTSTERILTVCMDDLPPHLKPCFLYFAGFTAQTPIDAVKLLRLWVAEGFIQAKNGQTTEERGAECLKELISRCLVQLVETDAAGKVTTVSVHQAVLDFVQAEAHDTNFLHVHSTAAVTGISNCATRRLSLRNTYDADITVIIEAPKLHTLICDIPERATTTAGKPTIFQKLLEFINGRAPTFSVHGSKFLRVMDLKGVRMPNRETLPEEIGWLIHLRYLGLSHAASMKRLPNSINKLRNLQTLDVSHTDVEALPWRFWRNPTLRHVLARRLAVTSAPDESDVLPDLQTLHGVQWGRWARSGGAIEKMTSLRSLMARNVAAATGELLSALASLECLRSLYLEAVDDTEMILPMRDILAMLGLRQLQYLTLRGKVEAWNPLETTTTTLPVHHGHQYLIPNLAKLELHRSECDESLIDVLARLPNLAELLLDEASYIKPYMRFPIGGFAKLRKMQMTSLDKLTECTVVGEDDGGSHGGTALPLLQHVSVFHCGNLNKFPVKLPKLDLFTIHDSEELKKFMEADDKKHINVVHGRMPNRRRVVAPKER
uniref:AAA+ ATPase domain-containing protein n=1 Tax=Leersia perrieri TaxID=77586 RepID=A0A0D9X564_9ORYZ